MSRRTHLRKEAFIPEVHSKDDGCLRAELLPHSRGLPGAVCPVRPQVPRNPCPGDPLHRPHPQPRADLQERAGGGQPRHGEPQPVPAAAQPRARHPDLRGHGPAGDARPRARHPRQLHRPGHRQHAPRGGDCQQGNRVQATINFPT